MNLVLLMIAGLCIGSFINAFVWRLHEDKNWVTGRSECPKCSHKLQAIDLIPVASWVALKGKCRYCHKTISVQYPVVETLTAGLFIFFYHYWSLGFSGIGLLQFFVWLIFLTGFIMLIIYDIKWKLLPNRIIYPLIILAIFYVLIVAISTREFQPIIDSLFGAVVLSGLFYVLFLISKGRWIGGGDVKLGLILGLLVGNPVKSLITLYFASTLGCIYAFIRIGKGKSNWKSTFAFGPFLIVAGIVVYLFGQNITNWYLSIHF